MPFEKKPFASPVTIRFQGVTPMQLAALHQIADETVTEWQLTYTTGKPAGGARPYIEVSKADLNRETGTYTVILAFVSVLEGPAHMDCYEIRATIKPSSLSLQKIFDVLGIFPTSEQVDIR